MTTRYMHRALILTIVLGVAGCKGSDYAPMAAKQADTSAAGSPAATSGGAESNGMVEYAKRMAAVPASGGKPQSGEDVKPEQSNAKTFAIMADSQPDRYLIKDATVTVEADDVRKATNLLVESVQAAKGYVSDVHEQTDGLGGLSATMQVRVPYTVFDRSMQQLASLGKILDKQVTAQDVTEEFVDTQAKVRNLKRTESRLLDHLTRTGRLSDTLLIEKELNRVREEVEQLEGRVRFLSHRIAFSTITLTIKEKARVQALVPPTSYSAAKESSDAIRSLVEFGRGLLSMLIWVGVWIPVWGPLAFVALLILRSLYRKYRAEQKLRHAGSH
jgi:hypothetical protein